MSTTVRPTTAVRFTSADLALFPDDGKRREVIDGELFVSTQPHLYHQICCDGFVGELNAWGRPLGRGRAISAPGLIFADDDDVVPDVVWVSAQRMADILVGGKFHGAPEVAIEVLSPGARQIARDRQLKRKLYARQGVDEYWIADWPRHTVEVYRRAGALLTLAATLGPGDTLTSPLLPGFALPLNRLFAGIPLGGDEAAVTE